MYPTHCRLIQPRAGPAPRAFCTGGLDPRYLTTALSCRSFPRKGEVLAYVGRNQTLKDLTAGLCLYLSLWGGSAPLSCVAWPDECCLWVVEVEI